MVVSEEWHSTIRGLYTYMNNNMSPYLYDLYRFVLSGRYEIVCSKKCAVRFPGPNNSQVKDVWLIVLNRIDGHGHLMSDTEYVYLY